MQREGRHAAILLKDLDGGCIQKMRLAIAGALVARGHRVELLAMRPEGALFSEIPTNVPVRALDRAGPFAWRAPALAGSALGAEVVLRTLWPPPPSDAFAYLPALISYLRRKRPTTTSRPVLSGQAFHRDGSVTTGLPA